MADAAHGWGHDALATDLAGHLSGPETMVWTDMQLGPSGSPRPDVYLLRKSYSKPIPLAFECKISRSDLRSDTTSGKWQSYLKYACGVVFAVPDGLCTVADIPDSCGLIVRKAATWRYARRPTLQRVTPPFEASMKLLIDGVSRTYRTAAPVPRKIALWQQHEAIRKRFGKDVADTVRDIGIARSRLADLQATATAAWEAEQRQITMRAKHLKEQFAQEEAQWAAARTELLAWLGLGSDSSLWRVQHRIAELKRECTADSRVKIADDQLARARGAIEQALRQLPTREPHPVVEVQS